MDKQSKISKGKRAAAEAAKGQAVKRGQRDWDVSRNNFGWNNLSFLLGLKLRNGQHALNTSIPVKSRTRTRIIVAATKQHLCTAA